MGLESLQQKAAESRAEQEWCRPVCPRSLTGILLSVGFIPPSPLTLTPPPAKSQGRRVQRLSRTEEAKEGKEAESSVEEEEM